MESSIFPIDYGCHNGNLKNKIDNYINDKEKITDIELLTIKKLIAKIEDLFNEYKINCPISNHKFHMTELYENKKNELINDNRDIIDKYLRYITFHYNLYKYIKEINIGYYIGSSLNDIGNYKFNINIYENIYRGDFIMTEKDLTFPRKCTVIFIINNYKIKEIAEIENLFKYCLENKHLTKLDKEIYNKLAKL